MGKTGRRNVAVKTKEELNAIKEEYETVKGKLAGLSEDELKKVVGGLKDEDRLNFPDKIRENPDGRIVYVM